MDLSPGHERVHQVQLLWLPWKQQSIREQGAVRKDLQKLSPN